MTSWTLGSALPLPNLGSSQSRSSMVRLGVGNDFQGFRHFVFLPYFEMLVSPCHVVSVCFMTWLDFSPDEFFLIFFLQFSVVEQTWWTALNVPTVPQTDGPIITYQRAIYRSSNQAAMALSMSSCERTRDTESSFRYLGHKIVWFKITGILCKVFQSFFWFLSLMLHSRVHLAL